jgi:TolB-like protein
MKKNAFLLSVLLMMSIGSVAFAGGGKEQGKSLDTAIAEAAAQIEAEIEQGAKVAPFSFNSPADQFSEYVLDELSADLVMGKKLVIVDRANLDSIRSELDFNLSGEVDDKAAQEAGRMLGAQVIVTGSLTSIGNTYRLALRAITVESAEVVVLYRSDIANDSRVKALLAGGKSGNGAPTIAQGRAGAQGSASGSANSGSGANSGGSASSGAANSGNSGSSNANSGGGNAAPAQPAAPAKLPNGTYTFWPRPQGMWRGIGVEAYLDKIVVNGDYVVFYMTKVARGKAGFLEYPYAPGHQISFQNALVQDTDNPAKTFNKVGVVFDSDIGCVLVSFRGMTSRHIELSDTLSGDDVTFSITIGEPD